jgi:hypothetical protein
MPRLGFAQSGRTRKCGHRQPRPAPPRRQRVAAAGGSNGLATRAPAGTMIQVPRARYSTSSPTNATSRATTRACCAEKLSAGDRTGWHSDDQLAWRGVRAARASDARRELVRATSEPERPRSGEALRTPRCSGIRRAAYAGDLGAGGGRACRSRTPTTGHRADPPDAPPDRGIQNRQYEFPALTGLLAQELLPARPCGPRRRPKTISEQGAPDRARRHA